MATTPVPKPGRILALWASGWGLHLCLHSQKSAPASILASWTQSRPVAPRCAAVGPQIAQREKTAPQAAQLASQVLSVPLALLYVKMGAPDYRPDLR